MIDFDPFAAFVRRPVDCHDEVQSEERNQHQRRPHRFPTFITNSFIASIIHTPLNIVAKDSEILSQWLFFPRYSMGPIFGFDADFESWLKPFFLSSIVVSKLGDIIQGMNYDLWKTDTM